MRRGPVFWFSGECRYRTGVDGLRALLGGLADRPWGEKRPFEPVATWGRVCFLGGSGVLIDRKPAMCGITGIISPDGISDGDACALGRMMDSLAHRGPDESGQYRTNDVLLGHRRLSIIDLETGRQPLADESGSVHAVVNGEFYNFLDLRERLTAGGHVFRTTSDSECLVHLYEESQEGCLDSLDGMFAFALWDERTKTALLARDRLGVKPLYYYFDGARLVFGSELKAILAAPNVPVDLDATALLDYLTYSFIPSPKTIFRNVHKLPAGHMLLFCDGRITVRPYWDLEHRGYSDLRGGELAGPVWEAMRAATRPRLISDVPVGAFLSGGLDSSAVVAAMSEVARNDIVTVTCGFDERGFDERSHAREVAELLGTTHHETLVSPDAADIVDTLCRHFDEPFADASAIPMYYLSQQARRFVTVALSGDGGDETMAGYRRYRFDRYEDAVRGMMPAAFRRFVLGPIASVYPSRPWMPRALRGKATLRNLSVDGATAHGLSISTMSPEVARRFLNPDVARAIGDYDPLDHARALYGRCDAPDHLSKCQYVDIKLGLADGILAKVDRASMAHGLEVRSPMLDHRFIEFVWSIPPRERIRRTEGKVPLRDAVRGRLGGGIAGRPKAGFEVPLDRWFRGPLKERFHDSLVDSGSPLRDWFSSGAIRGAWERHLAGKENGGPTLWKLAVFEAWSRAYGNGLGGRRDVIGCSIMNSG